MPVRLKSLGNAILCRAPGAPSASQLAYAHRRPRCDSRCQERGDVPSRVTRLWCGTACPPARAHQWQQAPRRATPALYLACTQTTASIAASCITSGGEPVTRRGLCIPSKHVQVVPHGHHAVTVSRARRGARDACRIELLPLLLRRREPKEFIRGLIREITGLTLRAFHCTHVPTCTHTCHPQVT